MQGCNFALELLGTIVGVLLEDKFYKWFRLGFWLFGEAKFHKTIIVLVGRTN